jgi:hypothetical protein
VEWTWTKDATQRACCQKICSLAKVQTSCKLWWKLTPSWVQAIVGFVFNWGGSFNGSTMKQPFLSASDLDVTFLPEILSGPVDLKFIGRQLKIFHNYIMDATSSSMNFFFWTRLKKYIPCPKHPKIASPITQKANHRFSVWMGIALPVWEEQSWKKNQERLHNMENYWVRVEWLIVQDVFTTMSLGLW